MSDSNPQKSPLRFLGFGIGLGLLAIFSTGLFTSGEGTQDGKLTGAGYLLIARMILGFWGSVFFVSRFLSQRFPGNRQRYIALALWPLLLLGASAFVGVKMNEEAAIAGQVDSLEADSLRESVEAIEARDEAFQKLNDVAAAEKLKHKN